MSQTALKISVLDPKFTTPYYLDVSGSVKSGQYGFDGNGCAAGSLATTLTWEQIESKGWGLGRNCVEISTYDGDSIQAASAAGATKLYVLSTKPYDPAVVLETAQIAIDDGVSPCYFIPVTGVGTDGGGNYITVGSPLHGGVAGNPSTLPAYAIGARIYRRRWSGRIAQRTKDADRTKKATLVLQGIAHRLAEIIDNFAFNAYDAGQALYQTIANNASSFTDLNIGSMVSVTIGSPFTGNYTNAFVSDCLNNILASIAGDIWTVRVGSDRIPRILKLYTASTLTYTYAKTFATTQLLFIPLSVETVDQDTSQMANTVMVVGDTNPQTQNAVTAVAADTTSQGTYLEIDAAPYAATGVKDQTTASQFAAALLQQNGYPQAQSSFKLALTNSSTANAIASSATGLPEGDQVYGFESIVVTGINQQSDCSNAAPDSGIQFGTGPLALWAQPLGTSSVSVGASPDGQNAWSLAAAGGATQINGPAVACAPGQVWTFTGYINGSGVGAGTGGYYRWNILNLNTYGVITFVQANYGASAGTPAPVTFTVPAGCTSFAMCATVNGPSGATGNVLFAQPNLSRGSTLKPYVVNLAAEAIYGLPSSVISTFEAAGDRQQQITFAPVVPNINAIVQERANATAAALLANTAPPVNITSYCVSANANQFTYSGSSLVLQFPAFLALFAQGSALVSIPATNVTLPASNTTWVWLQTGGTFLTQGSPAPVAGAILIGFFTTNATGVIGAAFRASIGVFQVGFGNINATSTLPAPTWSGTPSVTNGAAITGLATAVDASVALNNVPTNGTAAQILWLYRQSASAGGSGAWIPYEAQNLTLASGSVYPAATQTQTFEYDLNNGSTYDIAVAYVGLAGYGPLSIVQSGFVVDAIGIPNSYMLAGPSAAPAPTYATGATATPTGSNGLTAAMALSFTINNQPTDGSLSRISVWYTTTAISGTWTYVGSFPAYGVGSVSPPASHGYTFTVDSLANGTTYGFGCSFENAQGGETPISQFATATAQTIAITTPYLYGGSLLTPTFSGTPTAGSAPTLAGLTGRVALRFTLSNQPTDGSLSQIAIYMKATGTAATAWSQQLAFPAEGLPTPPASWTYYIELPDVTAGVELDFGVAYENNQGNQSAIATIVGGYTPYTIGIANAYMLPGPGSLPVVTGTATPTGSNGLTAAMQLAFTPTNQPTDGSLSRISIWYTTTAISGTWTYVGSFPAYGVGTSSPPASGSYTFTVDSLVNGTTYGFGISYENAQGGETGITQFATATAQTIAITVPYLIAGSKPTPTFSAASTISSAPALAGVALRVILGWTINNQPTDGSLSQIAIYYRIHGSGNWSQAFAIPAAGLPNPTNPQSYSNIELPAMTAGVAYDFGIAYENAQGGQGGIAAPAAWSNYTPAAIAIANSYMLAGQAAVSSPTYASGASATPTGSNGLTAAMALSWTINNQPTDGSLSRISVWYTTTAISGTWTYVGSFAASGVGSSSPPASGSYTFTVDSLVNGTTYGFGCSFEDAQGGEGTISQFATATAQTIAITVQYLSAGGSPTTAPTFSGTPTPASQPTLAGFAARVGIGFTLTNQPVDGSLSQIGCYYRNTGANWSKAFAIPAAPLAAPLSASQTYYFEIADVSAGVSIDLGCTYENAQGGETPVTALATGYTPLAIGIASQYMLAGSTLTPVVSSPTAANGTSADGINASIKTTFTLTNQPTDGSLSRVQVWVRVSSAGGSNTFGGTGFAWSPYGSQPATGLLTSPPTFPASGAYSFTLADITNGNVIDIGVSYENAQGGESTIAVVVSSFAANAINLPASGTAFQNLLTDQFIGLAVNSTNGFLAMPVGAGIAIYPSTQSDYLGPYVGAPVDQAAISSYATFVMRFQLTSTSASGFISASMFTSATTPANTFTSGYYITYTPGSPPTITLSKLVSGTNYSIVSRSAAIAASGFYAAVPALPNSDLAFHELRVVIIPGSGLIVAAAGITIEIYLDSVLVLSFAESTTTAAVTTGPSYFSFGGNIGGAAPYTSGTCGPGSNGFAAVYLDPQDLVMTGTQGGKRYEAQQAQALMSQAAVASAGNADGSVLKSTQISARHFYGGNAADSAAMVDSTSKLLFTRHHASVQAALTAAAGADGSYIAPSQITRRHSNPNGSGNVLRNPRFLNALAGWGFYSNAPTGELGSAAATPQFGGSVAISSGSGRGSTVYADEIYQNIFTAGSFGLSAVTAFTVSVLAYATAFSAGGSASLQWSDNLGGGATLATLSTTGVVTLLSGTFTPTSGATTVNVILQVASSGSAASYVIFAEPVVEQGNYASPFRDDNATSLLALTHEVELASTGSLRSQIVQDRHIAASVPRKNLVVNGNNCAGTGATAPSAFGWTGLYNTTAVPFSGGNYGPFTSIGFAKTSTASQQGYFQDVPVTPGQTYTFQTLIYDTSGSCVANIWIGKSDYSTQYNASPSAPVNAGTIPAFYTGAATHANATSTTSTAGWAHLYGTFTVPSGVSSVRVLMYDSGSVASLSFYTNGIMLTEGDRLQDYIDHEGNAGSISNRHFSPGATVDGINDGSTYQRMPIANMDANRRALINFNSSHINNPFSGAGANAATINLSTIYLPPGTAGVLAIDGNSIGGTYNQVASFDCYGNLIVAGTFTPGGQVVLAAGGAAIKLTNTTNNWLLWPAAGVGAPSFTTRSAGTREVYYPDLSGSTVDYARGIAGSTLWDSVPNASSQFQWYAGTAVAATLSGAGALATASTIAGVRGSGSTAAYVPPALTAAGASVASTYHIVQDVYVCTTTGNPTITLSGDAAFSSNNYTLKIQNAGTGADVAPSAKSATSFQFPAVSGQTYALFAAGV